ncbi:MAG: tRNA-(ms[2]io[6]A)-hydroxylase [Pseudomonadales bacterium]|nr:tRNA-(ms[2]io[6]A)-hydroxylase [Pseudomonadales bacterium]
MTTKAIQDIIDFLHCRTPQPWVELAALPESLPLLLIDHANCEKKAASTALNLMYRYVDKYDVLNKMSRLAREELRHFEQVIAIMQRRGISYEIITASSYASSLHRHIRTHEPAKLIDTLIVGAIIEARSCERFYRLAPALDTELASFYLSLLKSESRHYRDYLTLAKHYSQGGIEERVSFFLEKEQMFIESVDSVFRFHSGLPAQSTLQGGVV